MEPWTNYITELHQAFGYLFANWVPQQPIALGDYGRFQKDVFHRDGRLEDLGIKVQRGAPDEARALYQYHSKNSSSGQLKLNASGKASGAAKAKAGLEIKFADANSAFFNAAGCALRTATNISAIGHAVRGKLDDGTWEYDWAVVTSLIDAKSTTAIISSSSNGAIVLNADADVPNIDLPMQPGNWRTLVQNRFLQSEIEECPPIIDVGEQFLGGNSPNAARRRATQSYESRAYSINCSSTFPDASSLHS